MYRSHSCGELNASHINTEVTLAGWVQKSRDKGFMIWVDLRDRYGLTQLIFDEKRTDKTVFEKAKSLGREYVIQIKGKVIERESKNLNMPTGEIEILVSELTILNEAIVPPFTIEDETDGGEDLRMKYRYLDIRRNPVKNNLLFRHKVSMEVRKYLSDKGFCDIETPYLIKSTPEGARDFVVPSRMNEGQFYALPQSPQTFKQLLMVGGMDKYFQIVKCFRDEDLRADRQPEFTQIDCEMAFVEQEDILDMFEGLTRHLLKEIKGIEVDKFPRITYDYAMKTYGNDKPDIRFEMKFGELNAVAQHKDFGVFNAAELVVGIAAPGCASYTRKEIDALIAACGKKLSTFLQLAKETAARSGELQNLKWKDLDVESRTIRITAEKNSNPRILKISSKCLGMLQSLPKTSEKIFGNINNNTLRTGFGHQRRRVARRLDHTHWQYAP